MRIYYSHIDLLLIFFVFASWSLLMCI